MEALNIHSKKSILKIAPSVRKEYAEYLDTSVNGFLYRNEISNSQMYKNLKKEINHLEAWGLVKRTFKIKGIDVFVMAQLKSDAEIVQEKTEEQWPLANAMRRNNKY